MKYNNMTTEELQSKLEELYNDLGAIEYSINKIETELFYREHPESRPKPLLNSNQETKIN